MLTTHTRFPQTMLSVANKALPTSTPVADAPLPSTPSVDSFEKVKPLPPPVAASVRSGMVFQIPFDRVKWRDVFKSCDVNFVAIQRMESILQETNELTASLKLSSEDAQFLAEKIRGMLIGDIGWPLQLGEIIPGISKAPLGFSKVEVLTRGDTPVAQFHAFLVRPFPEPDKLEFLCTPSKLRYLGVDNLSIRMADRKLGELALFEKDFPPLFWLKTKLLKKSYRAMQDEIFAPLRQRVLANAPTLSSQQIEKFIQESMTTNNKDHGYPTPQAMSNLLRYLGIDEIVEKNRKDFQTQLDAAITKRLEAVLLPVNGERKPLTTVEHTLAMIDPPEKEVNPLEEPFSDYILTVR